MFLRELKKLLRLNRDCPYGKCFVSFAYADEDLVDGLRKHLSQHVRPYVFPPINVPPEKMVSNDLLSAIRRCDTLIYIWGGQSVSSPWVTLERDFALRSGMDVYSFDPQTLEIKRDTSKPLRLPVFASFSRTDGRRVQDLIAFMRRKRSFDIWMDEKSGLGGDIGATLGREIYSRLDSGGYLALFWSSNAAKSLWVGAELKMALEKYPNRVIPALMDPVDLPTELKDINAVKLYGEDYKGIDKRRLDDLIVRLYWLIQQNAGSA